MTEKPMKDAAHERRRAALRPVYRHIEELVTGHPLCFTPSEDGDEIEDRELLDLAETVLFLENRRKAQFETWTFETREANRRAQDEITAEITKALRRANKVPAKTVLGIFAKAIILRRVKANSKGLGWTLANELLSSPAVRRALRPAEVA